jgi:hypothetical protein
MKIQSSKPRVQRPRVHVSRFTFHVPHPAQRAFTMIEIALCLAIIGFALVAIIGILPFCLGMQKDNRQETIINQEATIWMDAIRNGERGLDDLVNYVVAITNFQTKFSVSGNPVSKPLVYTPPFTGGGHDIIGLLSTPKYVPFGSGRTAGYYSNYLVAVVRSMSGAATDKFPQNNPILRDLGLTYRLVSEVIPCSFADPSIGYTNVTDLHEVRLTFRWPFNLQNGVTGPGRQVFRSTVSGLYTNEPGGLYYFIQPRTL